MKHTPFDFDSLSLLAVGLPESLKSLRYAGRFEEELAEIDRLLADDTHPVYEPILKARLELERILAAGVSYDFSVTWADMMEKFRADYPGFAEKDLFALIDSGHADTLIGPEPLPAGYRFQVDAYDNLTDCCEGYLYELTHPGETYRPTMNALRHEAMAHMKKHGRMAVRFTLTESIAPKEDFVFPGKRFRAWLPFPAVTPEQSGIELLSSNRPVRTDDHPIRTAYAEFDMAPGEKLEIRFRFTNTATYHDLSDEAAREGFPDEVRPYLAEQYPHIRFTPYLTMLAKELTGGITNPLAKARAIYNYVTTHVRYSYMREYRWMDNLPEYPAMNGRGDCGVQALLFITLCRLAGVPARWQSGNSCRPTGVGSHDWALFYVEPWGWMPCDPSFGGGMLRNGDEEGHAWYFGNLDPYRFVACTEFQKQLSPAKTYFRFDPYDNQSGEAEYEDLRLDPWETVRIKRVEESETVE